MRCGNLLFQKNAKALSRGAVGRARGRHQNPAGKNPLGSYPWASAKEPGQKGYPFLNTRQADSLAACAVRSPWAPEEPPPILAAGTGLTRGSWHHSLIP